jgi:hypothetical protein
MSSSPRLEVTMLQVDRQARDCFAFLASPMASGCYGVMIYPELPELNPQAEVSQGKLHVFLLRHRGEVEVEQIVGTEDLFVSAVTEDWVRELMGMCDDPIQDRIDA